MKRFLTICLTFLGCSMNVLSNYDCIIDGIAYNKISSTEFEVTRINGNKNYEGDIVIPNFVLYKGKNYVVTRIGNEAFENDDIESISLPNTLITIGKKAFEYCRIRSKKLAIPASLRKVEYCGLHSIIEIEELYLEDIASWCTIEFENDNAMNSPLYVRNVTLYLKGKLLEDVVIPDGVTRIAHCSFKSTKIKSVSIPNSVEYIGDKVFSGTSIKNIKIPYSVKTIGSSVFNRCEQLESISIPDNVTKLGTATLFLNCKSLKNIYLPSTLKRIDDSCFSGCSSLENINIPNTVEVIARQAFYGCSKMRVITLPRNLKEMEGGVFEGCDNLDKIIILAETPPKILDHTFTNEQNKFSTLYVPTNSINLYRNAPKWKNFIDIYDIALKTTSQKKESNIKILYDLDGIKKTNNGYGLRIIYSDGKYYKTIK